MPGTFTTNATITTQQPTLASMDEDLIEGARIAAYSRIVSALTVGEYPTRILPEHDATTASPWGGLRMLEARLVALDLLGGGAGSAQSAMAGNNFSAWKEYVENLLTLIEEKHASFINDDTGEIVSGEIPLGGIESDERDPGMTLNAPSTWTDPDELDTWGT